MLASFLVAKEDGLRSDGSQSCRCAGVAEWWVPKGNSCSGTGEFIDKILELYQYLMSTKGTWDLLLSCLLQNSASK